MIEHHKGGTTFTGAAIPTLRLTMMLKGLALELKGMKLTRGVSCYALAKQEFGFKGNKQRVYDQLLAYMRARLDVEERTDEDRDAMIRCGDGY
jgi:hypothetical protein